MTVLIDFLAELNVNTLINSSSGTASRYDFKEWTKNLVKEITSIKRSANALQYDWRCNNWNTLNSYRCICLKHIPPNINNLLVSPDIFSPELAVRIQAKRTPSYFPAALGGRLVPIHPLEFELHRSWENRFMYIDWLIGWLDDWLNDWLIGWFID